MSTLFDLNYVQTFQQLPQDFFSPVQPQGVSNPQLATYSEDCAALIGLDGASLKQADSLQLISGNGVLNIWAPIAMKYTGHQFGYYNPDLGDGRGLLLAQVQNDGTTWDLHLKGAGLTPYSRQGDGRAVLRSSIREFLCSEAMAALGIPTTRALSLITSDTPVAREKMESAAMIIRMSQSHIRFGHFEFASFRDDSQLLIQLCDHVIAQHYPHLQTSQQPYEDLYQAILANTAKLMAQWQAIGFNHGVMNTDNMSILGETFDYGPFAFLDDYDPEFICNHSDHQGRYRFSQQPNIANWNLAVLAQAFLPLVKKERLLKHLDSFSPLFKQHYLNLMASKLGLKKAGLHHEAFINLTMSTLATCRLDYSHFFRQLSHIQHSSVCRSLRDQALDVTAFDHWLEQYQQALQSEGQMWQFSPARAHTMNAVNPKYILRNYLAQQVIEAAEQGDFQPLNKLHRVLQQPFAEQTDHQAYADLPPDWGKHLEISCSS